MQVDQTVREVQKDLSTLTISKTTPKACIPDVCVGLIGSFVSDAECFQFVYDLCYVNRSTSPKHRNVVVIQTLKGRNALVAQLLRRVFISKTLPEMPKLFEIPEIQSSITCLGFIPQKDAVSLGLCFMRKEGIQYVVAHFPQLQKLDISYSPADPIDIGQITSLQKLQELDIASTSITDATLAQIASNLPELQMLNVSGCKAISAKGFHELASLQKLRKLSANLTQINCAALEKLANLPIVELSIHNTNVDAKIGGILPQFSKLKALSIISDKLSHQDKKFLKGIADRLGIALTLQQVVLLNRPAGI